MCTFQLLAFYICAVFLLTGLFSPHTQNLLFNYPDQVHSHKISLSFYSPLSRYFAICRPLEYPLLLNKRTVFFMLANVWVLPALISFTPIFLGWYTTDENLRWLEQNPNECVFVVNKIYAVVSSSISFWIPGVVMITMYYRIFK
jgi:hypothetical protein